MKATPGGGSDASRKPNFHATNDSPELPSATPVWICFASTKLATSDSTPRGAELLFLIITLREERASIACASNAPFSEWGATFTDPRLSAAVVDLLTFNAHIIQTGSQSYRLNASRQTKEGTAA